MEEKRQLMKLVLSNTRIEGRKVLFEAQKPFNTILDFADRQAWLENRNINITMQLSHIYEAFSNFRLVAQIREEIEKVKPSLAFTVQ